MHTLVIAGDRRTAESIMRYYALREASREIVLRLMHDHNGPIEGYGAVSASHAYSALLGQRPRRIILGGDYLRWNLGQPGRLTNLWRMVEATRCADGTQVVFN